MKTFLVAIYYACSLFKLVTVSLLSCFLCNACKVKGGNNGKFNPPASPAACWKLATCCKLWRRAAECSCAFLLSSATLEDRWSVLGEDGASEVERREFPKLVRGFIGQHEHNPGKPENKNVLRKLNFYSFGSIFFYCKTNFLVLVYLWIGWN